MKKIVILILGMSALSCNVKKQPHPDYVNITGKIENAKSKLISIYSMDGGKKEINILADGTFTDSFEVKPKREKLQMMLFEDQQLATLYALNGKDIHFEADASDFGTTIKFSEDLADFNNYLNQKSVIINSDIGFDEKTWYRLDQAEFEAKTSKLKQALIYKLESFKNIKPDQVESEKLYINKYIERLVSKYEKEHVFATKLEKGNQSPVFNDYENYDGSQTSLSDFKGKYVFIDVWATWCDPCKYQIPYFGELEKEYSKENIVFVSISVDKQSDKNKWRNMVKDKNMSGVQILAPNDFASEFIKAYNITSIPRFILIDPSGNIVDFNAPRPSSKEEIHKVLELVMF